LRELAAGSPVTEKYFSISWVKPNLLSTSQPCLIVIRLHFTPQAKKIAVVSTNANSSGNCKVLDKNMHYATNHSPINILEIPT